MAHDNKIERIILTFQGTTTNGVHGGLVKAHERVIRLDGTSPQDKSCQFYLYKRFDVSGVPQDVYRFESVQYSNNNLYWNENRNVYLWSCNGTGMDNNLANLRNIWWSIVDCSNNPDCQPGSKLLKPFDFPAPVDTAPLYLVFEDPHLTPSLNNAIESGLMSLTEMT